MDTASALRLENQVLRTRVRELECANQELLKRVAAADSMAGSRTLGPPSTVPGAGLDGLICPNCGRTVPASNYEAHLIHCERNFYRCHACNEVVAARDKDNHHVQWTDLAGVLQAAEQIDLSKLRMMRAHSAALETAVSEETGDTLLHVAARKGNLELAAVVLGQRTPQAAWLTAMNQEGQAALHVAISLGHEAVVALFLESAADPDQRTTHGDTPLLLACRQGAVAIARRLIEFGADVGAKTALGDSALQVAQSRGHLECALALGGRQPSSRGRSEAAGSGLAGAYLRPLSTGKLNPLDVNSAPPTGGQMRLPSERSSLPDLPRLPH